MRLDDVAQTRAAQPAVLLAAGTLEQDNDVQAAARTRTARKSSATPTTRLPRRTAP
jgi:hypothetical protein